MPKFTLEKEIDVVDLNTSKPINLTFYYNSTTRTYSVSDADKIGGSLFAEKTLQNPYDEAKGECERRGVEMGEWTSEWDEINK